MLKKMKIFKLDPLKIEFFHLSMMHGQKCHDIIKDMEIEPEAKKEMKQLIDEFIEELVEVTELD